MLAALRGHLTVVTRLRLDARLFEPAPPRRPGTKGRPRATGARLPSLEQQLADPHTAWGRVRVQGWYGRTVRALDILSGTALWYHPGRPPVPIRWVPVRDVEGAFDPQGFLCTDLDAEPLDVLRWFVRRWAMEVTFAEVRRHLGVESQRQWSDAAIARTTPALLGLFSLVTVWVDSLRNQTGLRVRAAAWYRKPLPTFSDALAAVRAQLWTHLISDTSPRHRDGKEIPSPFFNRLVEVACHPA